MQRDARDAGRLGTVQVFHTALPARELLFVFSDESGWNADLDAAAEALSRRGAVVVAVDLPRYRGGLAASNDGCHYVISEIEDLSHKLQRELGFERYRSPILAGIGEGGTLAYAALAQSPAATIAGAVSIDPATTLETKVPLCPGAPATAVAGGGFRYGAPPQLPGWWRVASIHPLPADLASLVTPDGAGTTEPGTAEGGPVQQLVTVLTGAVLRDGHPPGRGSVGDLPLTEIPTAGAPSVMAVIYSGDGGWRDLDKQIGERLARHGIPVVGVDSLRYFWRPKTPEQVADDLADIVDHYTVQWKTQGVLLIGYSFGADVLPFAFNRLPAGDRSRVVQVSLLGLARDASFEIKVAGWLGVDAGGGTEAVLPEVKRMDPGLVQCFYGAAEDDTLCVAPDLRNAEIIRTTGGHHFDGDYAALADRIMQGAQRRAAARTRTSGTRSD